MNLISSYFSRVRTILLQPNFFFRELPQSGGLSGSLGFALTTHWLGAALSYLWRTAFAPLRPTAFFGLFEKLGAYPSVDQPGRTHLWNQFGSHILDWFYGIASVITDPFFTLISVLFSALLVFIGARLIVPSGQNGALDQVTYESSVRLSCYAMAPAILEGLPIFGSGIAWLWTWFVLIIGIKEVYRVSTGHAFLISLFPKLLVLGIIMIGLLLLSFFFFQFVVTGW